MVLYPNSDLRSARRRLALIVQSDDLGGLPQFVVAMITSRMFRANHLSRVEVLLSSQEGMHSGLLTDSVVMTDNLATIAELEIDRVIGMLPMNQINDALRHTLGL